MKNILCLFGFHKFKWKTEKSNDDGELVWEECKRCKKETEKMRTHTYGPFTLETKKPTNKMVLGEINHHSGAKIL